MLSFASPDLEERYQAYFSSNSVMWTAVTLAHGLVGCVVYDLRYFSASRAQLSQLPTLWWPGIAFAPVFAAMLALILLRLESLCAHLMLKHGVSVGDYSTMCEGGAVRLPPPLPRVPLALGASSS